MRKTITRTFTTSTVKVVEVTINEGIPETKPLADLTFDGDVSMEKAQREAIRVYKGKQVAIANIEKAEEKYAISADDFKKYGELIK